MNFIAYAEFETVLEIAIVATSSTTTETMYTQIARLLAIDPCTRSIFRGVVPKDGLPATIDELPVAFVCNTDDGDYFCSYDLPPQHAAFRTFMNKFRCNGYPRRTFVQIFGTDLVNNDCGVFGWLKKLRRGRLYFRLSYIDCATGMVVNTRK